MDDTSIDNAQSVGIINESTDYCYILILKSKIVMQTEN